MRNIKKVLVVLALFSFIFIKGNVLIGEENEGVPQAMTVSAREEKSDFSNNMIGRIVVYLVLLASIGVVIVYFFKQGKFVKGIRNQGGQLKVKETHVLGNRQFLVVVEYGKQRILLGVGPNMINQLCFLEAPELAGSEKNREGKVL